MCFILLDFRIQVFAKPGTEWNGIKFTYQKNLETWNGTEWNGMEWNGLKWNGMEWNGMECLGF
jgi:hypothetical protein